MEQHAAGTFCFRAKPWVFGPSSSLDSVPSGMVVSTLRAAVAWLCILAAETMSSQWLVSVTPTAQYMRWVEREFRMFSHPDWAQAIRALGADTLYCWDQRHGIGILLARFRRGAARIGFVGFPVAGAEVNASQASTFDDLIKGLCHVGQVDMLRINMSMQKQVTNRMTAARPEFWVQGLYDWRLSLGKKLLKDISFASRAKQPLMVLHEMIDPDACYSLYEQIVRAHRGNPRYTARYFCDLACIASRNPALKAYSACDDSGRVRAFSVMAIDGRVGWYLHGGSDAVARKAGVSDLLMDAMTRDALDAGCDEFSLMATPWKQAGLSNFKRKWSNSEGLAVTIDYPRTMVGHALRAVLRLKGRRDRAEAKCFVGRCE